MTLEITDFTLLQQIQNEFNKIYPHLWIEFFYYSDAGLNHSNREKIHPETPVKNLCALNGSKTINVNGQKSVMQLEKDFWETLGLEVQLLRKSGNIWVGIFYTGNWTLESQNFEGEQIHLD